MPDHPSISTRPSTSSVASGSGTRVSSDTDSHQELALTPDLTPSETPPRSSKAHDAANLGLRKFSTHSNMDSKDKEGAAKEEVEPPRGENSSTSKSELKQAKGTESNGKKACKSKHKHGKKAKKSHRKPEGDQSSDSKSSSSDDSSSSSEEDDSDSDSSDLSSDSDSEEKKPNKKKKKGKTRKALLKKMKQKARRKGKSRKRRGSTSESDSESSLGSEPSISESESEERLHEPKKLKSRGKSRKQKRAISDSDEQVEDNSVRSSIQSQIEELNASLAAMKLKQGRRSLGDGYKTGWRSKISNRTSRNFKVKDGESKKKRKRASKLEYKRVDELWDSAIHNYKLTATAADEDADEYDQYIFTVKRKFDWEGKYTDTVVDIKSQPLKEALSEVMDGVKGISLVEETPTVDPNMLFLYLEEMRTAMKELKKKYKTEKKKKIKKANARKASHVKVLVKYLDEDYAETKKTLYPLLDSNLITFDLLWALFKPNTIAYTPTYGNADEPRAFKVEYATKESSFMRGTWYSIEGRYLEYDGKSFGMGTLDVDVESFKGARKITGLATYPLKYHKDEEKLKQQLIERGKKFVALKGMKYRFHKGMGFYKKKRAVIKVNINGRIMVDPAIHRRINPNYPISPVKPHDPDDDNDNDDSDDRSCCCCGDSSEEGEDRTNGVTGFGDDDKQERTKLKVVFDDDGKPQLMRVDGDSEEKVEEKFDKLDGDDKGEEQKDQDFSDEELLLASPVVLGFAFSEKLWLEFTVSGINEIEWNAGAFDSLVLPENQKSIVKALVESHTFHAAQNIDDVIQGKGKGLVAVLHGPPGTGKTLTAEGIAELLKCPLYMVSAGELGTDPRTLEGELNKILDIAHSWGAVLLLDEADVFLEKRTIQDIHRNALVSIFLRLLEYFQGILFLTTNRVETFDDAFQSRIHIALRYGELTTKAKKTVWKMFLERVRAKEGVETVGFKESDYDALARNNLNGRQVSSKNVIDRERSRVLIASTLLQIKNCVRTAQALAVNKSERLSLEHIKRVLDVAESFDHDLRGGTGYMDAMRSYT
ncbi:MAG: hypothetical protein M1837_007542 [Sclerophora amabilis]|nr:MAG: hypothetical protein M1837_007542 [Sclerophora amabilis]